MAKPRWVQFLESIQRVSDANDGWVTTRLVSEDMDVPITIAAPWFSKLSMWGYIRSPFRMKTSSGSGRRSRIWVLKPYGQNFVWRKKTDA